MADNLPKNKEVVVKKKILLIDDDPLVLKTIQAVLKQQSFDCVSSATPAEAIQIANKENFDLIISDMRMPGMDGVQTIREIRRLFTENGKKDIPIIFITGYADMSQELDAEKLGEVILKPFDLNRLIMTLREYL